MALTDTEIKRAKPREKLYSMSDSVGLYLEITPAGGKLWRWKYRFEGKEKLMALGKYPQISLALARKRHGDGRQLLATGIDPMAHRKVEKMAEQVATENSFATVAAQWLEHWKDDKSARHVTNLIANEKGDSRISFEDYAVALVDEIETPAHERGQLSIGY